MGYLRLRYLLRRQRVALRDIADLTNRSVSEVYDLCGVKLIDRTKDFTVAEKKYIYHTYFTDSDLTLEEVFS